MAHLAAIPITLFALEYYFPPKVACQKIDEYRYVLYVRRSFFPRTVYVVRRNFDSFETDLVYTNGLYTQRKVTSNTFEVPSLLSSKKCQMFCWHLAMKQSIHQLNMEAIVILLAQQL